MRGGGVAPKMARLILPTGARRSGEVTPCSTRSRMTGSAGWTEEPVANRQSKKSEVAMKYEATVHFEVKDENVDLTDLIADQKVDIHGVGLVGRTAQGEVASEMEMMWGGEIDWRPEAKVKIAEATGEITRRLEVDEETAARLWEGMSDVYELMAGRDLCAYPGGEQSVRVIPEALDFIRSRAAALPER
jgi:hypothetical protein